jgi:hypothetical protein
MTEFLGRPHNFKLDAEIWAGCGTIYVTAYTAMRSNLSGTNGMAEGGLKRMRLDGFRALGKLHLREGLMAVLEGVAQGIDARDPDKRAPQDQFPIQCPIPRNTRTLAGICDMTHT